MDEGLMVKLLFLTLGLLFIGFKYFDIPFFGAIFLLIVFLIVKFHKKEKDIYNEEFTKYEFDFNLRQYENESISKKALRYTLLALLFVLFIIIPYDIRELSYFDYLYIAGFYALLFYVGSSYKHQHYYYFGKDFIKKPGKDFDKIFWSDIERVEEKEKDEIFILHLKTGEAIKFSSEIYYTLGKEKSEIIEYVRQKI